MSSSPHVFKAPSSLLPHQKAVIERFFGDDTTRVLVVRWDAGLGVIGTSAHLTQRLLAEQPHVRILVLAPKLLQPAALQAFNSIGVPAQQVDRYRYREMQGEAPENAAPWRRMGIYLLAIEFARQEDVTQSLCREEWSLVILLDGYRTQAAQARLVTSIMASSTSVRVIAFTVSDGPSPKTLNLGPMMELTKRREDVVDNAGQHVFAARGPAFESVRYSLDERGLELREQVSSLCQAMKQGDVTYRVLAADCMRALASSTFALESTLLRARNTLTHRRADVFVKEDGFDAETDGAARPHSGQPSTTDVALLTALDKCIETLDSLETDPKLSAFRTLLSNRHDAGAMHRATCVLTQYWSTQSYLRTALEELGKAPIVVNSSLAPRDYGQALKRYNEHGGLLILTYASARAVGAVPTDWLVLYDVPSSPWQLEEAYGNLVGTRRAPDTVTLLMEAEECSPVVSALSRVLRTRSDDSHTSSQTASDPKGSPA
jgi:hypothetical protein